MKTALVIGATGLTGSRLVRLLLEDDRYSSVILFLRRSSGLSHPKLKEHFIDFDDPESWREFVMGDVLFSCLGTTLKKAGGQEAQWKVDHSYQFMFAETASKNGVAAYVLISSAGADAGSRNFYLRMKGKLEDDVKKLSFRQVAIIRPGLLQGERQETRLREKIGETLLKLANIFGLLRSFRPVPAGTVARAMVNAVQSAQQGIHVIELDEVFRLARLQNP